MTNQNTTWISPSNHSSDNRYECFRNFSDPMIKVGPLSYKVVCKIEVPPALVERAFGEGLNSTRNGKYATKEWDFTDSNLDQFLLYDYKATTRYWGPNVDPLEYERLRAVKQKRYWREPRPTFAEFWQDSTTPHKFYVNATDHAEFKKFKIWFLKRIEEAKNDSQSFEEKAVAKFGPIQDFAAHDGQYRVDTDYSAFKYSRKDFATDPKWTPKDKFDFPFKFSTKLDDSHLIEG